MFDRSKAARKKAAVEIFSLIIVLVLSMALAGTTYMWGMPLITKRQDKSKIDRIYNYFSEDNSNSLVYKMQEVAKNGGREVFTSDIRGLWVLHNYSENSPDNNSIEFVSSGKVTNVLISDFSSIEWSSLTSGSGCPPGEGVVGMDSPITVCAKSEISDDKFNIIYRAWSRTLKDPSGTKGYKINLVQEGRSSSTGKGVIISRETLPYTCSPPNPKCPDKTLIITEIKIHLA